ncbi:MAG TPA: FtsX-like permease family protein [Terriglobales bacterium]|jgi:putative ABC transport system permease protein|nr:FtsX-like permease family protein [Terriglobales bacterium]
MTLTRFVTKSAFRNKRRSILTVLSITFSLLLLTLMMTIWHTFYIDKGDAESAERLVTRHRVSLTESMPSFYREKIRTIPGVVAVAPTSWFGGIYKDAKPENFFAQFGTDPEEIMKIFTDFQLPPDQLLAWQRDRAGVIVDDQLARKYGWKLGDRIVLQGTIYPVDLELTIRGIYTGPQPTNSVYFNQKYVEEAVSFAKGQAGTFDILADSPDNVSRIASAVDNMFHNSPEPTKTESEKAFQLTFINSIGNVKAFILSICFAVVFATLLVSATTMAMSIRERTREVAVLKTLGFTRQSILKLYIGEAVLVALTGGAMGCLLALLLVSGLAHAPGMGLFLSGVKVTPPTLLLAIFVAGMVGLLSAILPAYHAAKLDIVEGLRYIG